MKKPTDESGKESRRYFHDYTIYHWHHLVSNTEKVSEKKCSGSRSVTLYKREQLLHLRFQCRLSNLAKPPFQKLPDAEAQHHVWDNVHLQRTHTHFEGRIAPGLYQRRHRPRNEPSPTYAPWFRPEPNSKTLTVEAEGYGAAAAKPRRRWQVKLEGNEANPGIFRPTQPRLFVCEFSNRVSDTASKTSKLQNSGRWMWDRSGNIYGWCLGNRRHPWNAYSQHFVRSLVCHMFIHSSVCWLICLLVSSSESFSLLSVCCLLL